jgi:hypothetical protein
MQGYLRRPVSMEINGLREKGLGPGDRACAFRKEVQEMNFTACKPACQCQQVIPGGPALTTTDGNEATRKPVCLPAVRGTLHVVDPTAGSVAKHLAWYAFLASLSLSWTEICAFAVADSQRPKRQ